MAIIIKCKDGGLCKCDQYYFSSDGREVIADGIYHISIEDIADIEEYNDYTDYGN